MPRKSKVIRVVAPNSNARAGYGSLISSSGSSIRRLVTGVTGQPATGDTVQTFPIVRKPSYAKAGIRRLIKRNVADGKSMPEYDNITGTAGVITGDRGGFKGGVAVMLQKPLTPPRLTGTGTGRKRIIATPRAGQGYLKTFNKTAKIRNTNKRVK